jgi:hypothetical protein
MTGMRKTSLFLAAFALVAWLGTSDLWAARVSRRGPAAHGSVRASGPQRATGSRQDRRRDAHDNRRDARKDVHDDRKDARKEVRDDRRDVRREVHEHHERWDRRRRLRIGSTLSIAAFRSLTCRPTVIVAGGVTYYSCDNYWYNQAYRGAEIVYIVVSPPPGY